jgi:hypothetical protein
MSQIWGGFEYDENPLYIYEYSDLVGHMDNFKTAVMASYKPVPTQEIAFQVSDTYTGKFEEEYGNAAVVLEKEIRPLRESHNPLTYIVNWNGSFADDRLQTRWAWGIQTQARGHYSRILTLGQRLNLSKLQWYVDYMGEWDDMDQAGIATEDLMGNSFVTDEANQGILPGGCVVTDMASVNPRMAKAHYHSVISKMNWQFAPQWNLMLKGTYELASLPKTELYKNYRRSHQYIGSIEYYPEKSQDFRLFLAYVGHSSHFSDKCGLKNGSTHRVELGFMYRIKCY